MGEVSKLKSVEQIFFDEEISTPTIEDAVVQRLLFKAMNLETLTHHITRKFGIHYHKEISDDDVMDAVRSLKAQGKILYAGNEALHQKTDLQIAPNIEDDYFRLGTTD